MFKKPKFARLAVDVDLGGTAAVPGSEQHAAAATLVLNILERVHEVRDTAEADETAETKSPSTRVKKESGLACFSLFFFVWYTFTRQKCVFDRRVSKREGKVPHTRSRDRSKGGQGEVSSLVRAINYPLFFLGRPR